MSVRIAHPDFPRSLNAEEKRYFNNFTLEHHVIIRCNDTGRSRYNKLPSGSMSALTKRIPTTHTHTFLQLIQGSS